MTSRLLIFLCCVALTCASARAQKTTQPTLESLSQQAIDAFKTGDLDAASKALDQLIDTDPDNFVHYYNLACVRSMQHKPEAAAELLIKAVEHGFTDIYLLRHDTSLENARDTTAIQTMLDNWADILDRRIETDLSRARDRYGSRYWYIKDPDLRLAYACAYDRQTLDEVQTELHTLYDWAMTNIFSQADTELVGTDDPWVLVVLPSQKDFKRWAIESYGPAAQNFNQAIGGHYSHDDKQLVTMDLGATLRHEFLHVLHWRSNTRHNQLHPVWVQEGLCSLIEDYDLSPNGDLIPVESWRTNQAQFLAKTGHLLHIKHLTAISRQRFTSSRPLAQYAQARALFLFIEREGKLPDWYAHFTEHFREDPTGLASIEAVLDGDLEDINTRYAKFCLNLPEVPEDITRGMPSLGIAIDAKTTGEGLRVATLVRRNTAGDLKLNDIITHIEARPVRDYYELVRVLTSYEPNQTVTIRYRRAKLHRETKVTLKAAE